MRLILIVVRGLAATRSADLRARLDIAYAEAGRLRNLGIIGAGALLLRDLIAIDVAMHHPASSQAEGQEQAGGGKCRFE